MASPIETKPEVVPVPKPKRMKKSFSTQMIGPKGDVLKIVTRIKREGIVTYVVASSVPDAKTKKRAAQRGCSVTHADMASANAAVEKFVTSATRMGWLPKPARPRGFQPKPDSFSELPKPAKK